MSIILEALNKASAKKAPVAESAAASVPGPKNNEVHDRDFNFSRTMFMGAGTIVIVGLVAILTSQQNGTQNTAAGGNKAVVAEGYSTATLPAAPKQEPTSISSFITKLSNPRLTLSGIVYGSGKPAAIIENKILEEGASVKGARIVKIHNNSVEMLDEVTGQGFVLKLD